MLINIVKTYLSVRQALGFKLQSVEKYLWSYANFRNCPRRYPGAQRDRCRVG
jgi:hypothetical protein